MSKNNLDKNNGIRKNDIGKKITSINDYDDDDEDIGENYDDEYSENMSRDVKYFFPKQSQAPSSYYFAEEKPRIMNRFNNNNK